MSIRNHSSKQFVIFANKTEVTLLKKAMEIIMFRQRTRIFVFFRLGIFARSPNDSRGEGVGPLFISVLLAIVADCGRRTAIAMAENMSTTMNAELIRIEIDELERSIQHLRRSNQVLTLLYLALPISHRWLIFRTAQELLDEVPSDPIYLQAV